MENVVITGVSAGIGYELAKRYLEAGYRVYGISRTAPESLMQHDRFSFCAADLSELEPAAEKIKQFLIRDGSVSAIKYLFLNAGQFSQRIAGIRNVPQCEIDYLMRLNVWSNKAVLDVLLESEVKIDTCLFSASIAGVRGRTGNGAYALSKATLLMLAKLYALENPGTFFSVLGLCLVETDLSRNAANLPIEGDFPEIALLRERAKTPGYTVSAEERAQNVESLLREGLKKYTKSGDFFEIRELLGLVRRDQAEAA